MGEHVRTIREHEGATREHIAKTSPSTGAKRRGLSQQPVTCLSRFGETILYIPRT